MFGINFVIFEQYIWNHDLSQIQHKLIAGWVSEQFCAIKQQIGEYVVDDNDDNGDVEFVVVIDAHEQQLHDDIDDNDDLMVVHDLHQVD